MASEDSNRSVADYFVVAGLPQKNPQLLDECSLEVNLKNGAYQDPITDIAVRVQHIDVLWGQLIKLSQVASTSELLENHDLVFFKIIPPHF